MKASVTQVALVATIVERVQDSDARWAVAVQQVTSTDYADATGSYARTESSYKTLYTIPGLHKCDTGLADRAIFDHGEHMVTGGWRRENGVCMTARLERW